MTYRLLSLGVNKTPFARNVLSFAELDALRMARVFTSSRGPIADENATVLLGAQASIDVVRNELDLLAQYPPENILFAWSGHGGDDGIALTDAILTYAELANRLARIDARVKIAVLSTCHAGAASRPFQTTIGGLEGIEAAWQDVLCAACPGLRLFTAVGPHELAYDDSAVQGSRFLWAFFRALRCARGDIEHDGHQWISDVALMPIVRSHIAHQWPDEALPSLIAPTGECGAFPLLVSQADEPCGSAMVYVAPLDGVAVRASVDTLHRKHVDTRLEALASTCDGTVVLSQCIPFLPSTVFGQVAWDFRVDERELFRNPSTGPALRAGLAVRLAWRLRVLDDHCHVLGERHFFNMYCRQTQVA